MFGYKPEVEVAVGYSSYQSREFALLLYTAGTFLVVLAIYLATRGWKGYTAPEEVDLGALHVPRLRPPPTRHWRQSH